MESRLECNITFLFDRPNNILERVTQFLTEHDRGVCGQEIRKVSPQSQSVCLQRYYVNIVCTLYDDMYCPCQRINQSLWDVHILNLDFLPSLTHQNKWSSEYQMGSMTYTYMDKRIKLCPLTDLSPESMYLTSCEMKQLSCRKFSLLKLGGSSSASTHFNSQSNVPPKYWSTSDLQAQHKMLFFGLDNDTQSENWA